MEDYSRDPGRQTYRTKGENNRNVGVRYLLKK